MKIKSVHIKNLRAIKDAVINLDDYTCFVGANGAGKSTVLFALNIFFREGDGTATDVSFLAAEDFHQKDTSQPIEIIVTFSDLNAEAQEDFKDYFRQGLLVISAKAEFNKGSNRAEVKQSGQRLGMADFATYFRQKGDGAKVDALRALYSELQGKYPELPKATTGPAMEQALNAHEAAKPELCTLLASADEFYGVSKGKNRLERHIQWVFVPAVKDATTEQIEGKTTALGKLLARTVRAKVNFTDQVQALAQQTRERYQQLLDESQGALDGVSAALKERLSHWAHPDASLRVSWQQDTTKSIRIEEPFAKVIAGEGDFEGELARFGHGYQRSFLLALLQELAGSGTSGQPRLILGCEEPELYQHPPQARHLSSILQTLAKGESQIIVSTHSPLFVAGDSFSNVRLVQRDAASKVSQIRQPDLTKIGQKHAEALGEQPPATSASLARIANILQPALGEMFFTGRLVLVEGIEDAAYLNTWLTVRGKLDDFRRRGCHIVSVGGKSELLRPTIIAAQMEIPTYVMFDGDADQIAKPEHKRLHERDNRSLLRFFGHDITNLFPNASIGEKNFTMWPNELGQTVTAELTQSLGEEAFTQVINEAHARFGHGSGLKKNTMLIGAQLALALDCGGASPSLDALCERLLKF